MANKKNRSLMKRAVIWGRRKSESFLWLTAIIGKFACMPKEQVITKSCWELLGSVYNAKL
jgi:hypothetical protein